MSEPNSSRQRSARTLRREGSSSNQAATSAPNRAVRRRRTPSSILGGWERIWPTVAQPAGRQSRCLAGSREQQNLRLGPVLRNVPPEDKASGASYGKNMRPPRAPIGAGITLLLLRGVLLWLVVPVAICLWMILHTFGGHRRVRLGQFLGWVDLNLTAGLQRTALRPLFGTGAGWTPWSEVGNVTHRVRLLDPI
jgi:hypothetical protein